MGSWTKMETELPHLRESLDRNTKSNDKMTEVLSSLEKTMVEDSGGGQHRTVDTRVEMKEDGNWYCPDCGERNTAGHMSCKGCGRYF